MTIPPNFRKQFERDEDGVEIIQANVIDIAALSGLTATEFVSSMSEIVDIIGHMATRALTDAVFDTPHDRDKISELIVLAYRCAASCSLLHKITEEEDLLELLSPDASSLQLAYDLARASAANKRKRKDK